MDSSRKTLNNIIGVSGLIAMAVWSISINNVPCSKTNQIQIQYNMPNLYKPFKQNSGCLDTADSVKINNLKYTIEIKPPAIDYDSLLFSNKGRT